MNSTINKILNLWKKPFLKSCYDSEEYAYPEQMEKMAELFSPGLQHHFIIDMSTLKIEFVSKGIKRFLGIDSSEFNAEFILKKLTPDQRKMVWKKESIVVNFFYYYLRPSERLSYKSVYTFKVSDHENNLRTILHQATPLTLTKDHKPKQFLVVHTDISHLYIHKNCNVNFINLNGDNSFFDVPCDKKVFNPNECKQNLKNPLDIFTTREKDIIKKISQGFCTEAIAEQMNISVHTLRTHRKNILKKSNYNNINELVAQFVMIEMV